MIYFRNICMFLLFFVICLPAFSGDNNKISFKWSFVKQLKDDRAELLDFSKEVKMTKDDKFKILFVPEKKIYFYIYYLDYNNELSLLFPENIDEEVKVGVTYSIPSEHGEWLQFEDGHGTDRFYIIASNTRLSNLDKFTKELQKNVEKNADADKINNSKKNVVDEIQNLRNRNSKYAVYAEKPTSIAGTSRGIADKKDGKEFMILVEAEKFYAKILRINH
jgi:hypothetical protein